MLNDEVGKYFRNESSARFDSRCVIDDDSACILIVDPILGSRFSLVQAVSQPNYVVRTASTTVEALSHLDSGKISLVIVDQSLSERDGIDFLVEIRRQYPDTLRALVTAGKGVDFMRRAIDRAGLSFLLSKPWSPDLLRKTIREVLSRGSNFAGWSRALSADSFDRYELARDANSQESGRQHEILLRGLLAGLNSCEFETEVFELLHTELAEPFHISGWLWVDEERAVATRIAGDWPVETNVPIDTLLVDETELLAKARQSLRVTRLNDPPDRSRSEVADSVCLSLTIRKENRRSMTCLISTDEFGNASLVAMLRELQTGLQMAFRRIFLAEARAIAASRLAKRVSEELRTPVGALTHAISRLRGETKRAGMSTEWVDRVSSESERVIRAVEHLEGEIFTDGTRTSSTAN